MCGDVPQLSGQGARQMCIRTVGVGLQRDGAFAQFVVLPAENVWVHHDAIEPEVGALFDPLGNAVHTALSFTVVGEDVLVSGCGPIGLMSIAVARHAGARFIVATTSTTPASPWPGRWARTAACT